MKSKNNTKPRPKTEFDKYLERQCLTTTFNGLEIETFKWYRKVFGLDEDIQA